MNDSINCYIKDNEMFKLYIYTIYNIFYIFCYISIKNKIIF